MNNTTKNSADQISPYKCIIHSPNVAERIRHMFYTEKMSPREILNTLKAEGMTVRGKPLLDLAHVTNRLAPTKTRWRSYRNKQDKLQSIFLQAYQKGSNAREDYVNKLTSTDIECIIDAVRSHQLPNELLMKANGLHKWFQFHREHDVFVKCKHAAWAEFTNADVPTDEPTDEPEERLSVIENLIADIATIITKGQQ